MTSRHPNPATVYVVVANWNGWGDAIECLESLFRMTYPSYRVVVCDNASSDGSVDQIERWAGGDIESPASEHELLRRLVRPPVPKPIAYERLSRSGAENQDGRGEAPPLVLIDTGGNLGFAGGTNVGLRYALRQPDCAYAWLLNSDTVVDADALGAMVRRLNGRPDAGQCGSRLVYYHDPALIQTFGGERYNKWLASSRPIGEGESSSKTMDESAVEAEMSCVMGASICVTRAFLESVGLLEESYFQYCEEPDWAVRSRGLFTIAYAHDSIVYHKKGATVGSSRHGAGASELADFFSIRNRLRFTWRHAPQALPTVLATMLVAMLNRARRKQFRRIPMILRLILSKDTYVPPLGERPEPIIARYARQR